MWKCIEWINGSPSLFFNSISFVSPSRIINFPLSWILSSSHNCSWIERRRIEQEGTSNYSPKPFPTNSLVPNLNRKNVEISVFKRLYPTLVTSTPSFADESSVFLQLLTTLNYGQVSLITMRGDSNGLRFAQKLINNAKLHKIHVRNNSSRLKCFFDPSRYKSRSFSMEIAM